MVVMHLSLPQLLVSLNSHGNAACSEVLLLTHLLDEVLPCCQRAGLLRAPEPGILAGMLLG